MSMIAWEESPVNRRYVVLFALAVVSPLLALATAAAQVSDQSPFDFDRLSNTIRSDQVDYNSGNWTYEVPLTTVRGGGAMSLPLTLSYSSAVTGKDRLIKHSTVSGGTHTLNNAG